MKKVFGKYFVISLSLLLILSNFSYATSLLICEMSGDTKVCSCMHKEAKKYEGISFTQERSKCCSEETKELTNSNTLASYNNELNHNLYSTGDLFYSNLIDLHTQYHSLQRILPDRSHLPKLDIPVLTSSLLI